MKKYNFYRSTAYNNNTLDILESHLNEPLNLDATTGYPQQVAMMKAGNLLVKHINKNNLHGVFCAINILNIEQASIYDGAKKSLNIWKEIFDTIDSLLPQNAYIGKVHFGVALHFWGDKNNIIDDFEALLVNIQNRLDALHLDSIKENDLSFHLTLFSKIGYVVYPEDTGQLENYLPLTKYAVLSTIDCLDHDYHSSMARYSESHYSNLQEKILLETNLFKQVSQREFDLLYQPQINLETKQIIGAEALASFYKMPNTKRHNTGYYIQILENSKYIIEFTYISFKKLILFLETYESSLPKEFLISFNLSRSIFKWSHIDILDTIKELIKDKRHLIKYIQIEMTESAYFSKSLSKSVLSILQNLHDLGFTISIDDFGTGYGSLAMLNSNNISGIKLDKTITRQLCDPMINTSFIESLLYATKQNNFKIMVEGIETEEEEEYIKNLGLTYAQGYKYSKNLSQKDFLLFLEENK